MANWEWRLKRRSGSTISVGDMEIVPESQSLEVLLPWGEFVWNRPSAVQVSYDGVASRFPVPDRTRQIVWTIMGLTVLAWLIGAMGIRKGKGERDG